MSSHTPRPVEDAAPMASRSEPTRIAFLSDIHLSPMPPFAVRHWTIKRGLGFANWQRKRRFIHDADALAVITDHVKSMNPNHVLVGGDLVNIGLPEEYAEALRWLLELGPPDRVTLVPGNHDLYTRLYSEPGFRRWQAYMTGEDTWTATGARPGDVSFPYLRRIGQIAIVALNSAHPTAPGSARGRLGQQQRADLIDLLHQLEAQGLFRIVLLHHPPLPGQAPWRRALANARALAEILQTYGAELVLHGHNHRSQSATLASRTGEIHVLGAGSASAIVSHGGEPLASYRLFDIAPLPHGGWSITSLINGLVVDAPDVVPIAKESWTIGPRNAPA